MTCVGTNVKLMDGEAAAVEPYELLYDFYLFMNVDAFLLVCLVMLIILLCSSQIVMTPNHLELQTGD